MTPKQSEDPVKQKIAEPVSDTKRDISELDSVKILFRRKQKYFKYSGLVQSETVEPAEKKKYNHLFPLF